MTKQVISLQQFNDDLRSCVLSAIHQFVQHKTGQSMEGGWCTHELKRFLPALDEHSEQLARRINAQNFERIEILVPEPPADSQPITFVSHPAWFWSFKRDDGLQQAGCMVAQDLREAVCNVLVSTLPNGNLFASEYRVPIDVLDEAPGNRQTSLVITRPGMTLEFHSL